MNRKKNKNGIRFLIFLVAFGFVAIKFGNGISNNMKVESWSEEVEDVAEEGCTTCGSLEVEEQVFPEETNKILKMPDGLGEVDIVKLMEGDEEELALFQSMVEENGDVKGLWEDLINLISNWNLLNFFSCNNFNKDLSIESAVQLCNDEASSTLHFAGADNVDDQGGQVYVNVNSRVVFSKVKYPLAYFLGQYVYENSKREISYRSTEYSASGEIIDIDYQAKTLPPGDASDFKEKAEDLGTSREPFLIGANLTLGSSGSAQKIQHEELNTKIGIENQDDAEGPCPFARHDFNPETSNFVAYDEKYGGYLRSQVPGGNNYELPENNQCYKENKNYYMSRTGNFYACFNLVEAAYSIFRKVFSKPTWDECTQGLCTEEVLPNGKRIETCSPPNPDKCVDATNIAIEMTPLFGKPYECNEPKGDSTDRLCANAFLTESYKGTLSPEKAGNKTVAGEPDKDGIMYFIGTDCELSVSSGKRTTRVPVTCLWDVTPSHLNYQLQAKDRVPGQEDFPQNFRSYWNGVLQGIRVSSPKYGFAN